MPAPTVPSATPASPTAAPTAAPVDPKSQVKATVEATKKGPEAQSAEDSWEVQIDGKPVKKSRKEILEAYQLRQLSDKKRSEADKVLAEYKKLFDLSKSDPIKLMQALGHDFDKLSTGYLAKKAEESMMDPKEREAIKTKAELEQYKKYVEAQKKANEEKEKSSAIEQERTKIHKDIIDAIEAHKELGLPVDEELVIQIAQKMLLQDRKQKPLDAKEALPKAYESTQKCLKGIASKMEGDSLVKWLGDDIVKKIRKYDLAKLKESRAPKVPSPTERVVPKASADKPKPQYKTWSQFKSETLDKII